MAARTSVPMMPSNLPYKTQLLNCLRSPLKRTSLEKALLLLVGGKNSNTLISKIIPNHYQYKKPSLRTATRQNIRYELDISDLIDWFIYFGMTEKSKTRLFSLVKPGQTILDVGTNIGETLLNFARSTGPAGKVIGFEPDSASFERCMRNLSLNNFKNVHLEKFALAHEENEFLMSKSDLRNPGANFLNYPDTNEHNAARTFIKAIRLDDYALRNELNQVDLIKIDVEGFEYNVLKGAEQTILKHRPLLFVELSHTLLKRQGTSASALVELLEKWDYAVINASNGNVVQASNNFEGKHFDVECHPL